MEWVRYDTGIMECGCELGQAALDLDGNAVLNESSSIPICFSVSTFRPYALWFFACGRSGRRGGNGSGGKRDEK
jgi:hypothetical protein